MSSPRPLASSAAPLQAAPAAAPPLTPWAVRLLGGFVLDDGQQRLTRLRSRAAMLLLARIALAPQRDHAREELAALLWPEADPVTSRSRLRQTLSLLKAVLEPPGSPAVLLADRRAVRAAPGSLWCDALAFEQALQQGQPEQAAALYRGELLPGFYDEWVLEERARLAARAEGSLPPAAAPVPSLPATVAAQPVDSPAVAATGTARLPAYLTRLIGADEASARLLAMLGQHRWVTVTGPGGCGKTRLAVEVARLASRPGTPGPGADGALFISLVGVRTRTALLDRLLLALRLAGDDAVERLLLALQGRSVLLLLDNAEELDDEALSTLALLAERTQQARWLATSRRALELNGERCLPLQTLPLPAAGDSLAEMAMNPAVALFVDRARAHRPDFHLSATQQAAMVALMQRLDGLPLAIELAAAQSRTLRPSDLLALLQQARPGGALALLARRGTRSGSDPRHASMWDVVDWSWRLLEPAAQRLLRRLALLPAGVLAPAAASLVDEADAGAAPAAPGATQLQAAQLLDQLTAHSTLRLGTGQDGQPRFAPYEPVREFVLAQADEGTAHADRGRVLAMLLAWAQALPATPPLPQVRDELPNVMQALAAAAADDRANAALQLVLLLQSSWGEIAVPAGMLQTVARLLTAPGLDDSLAAGGHALLASRLQEAGQPDEARRHVAHALARPCADPALRIMVLSRCARVVWRLDRDHLRARAMIDEALPLARTHGRPNSEGSLLSLSAHLATMVDRDPARGTELSAQALALWRRSGNRHLINAGRFNVATNRLKAGDHAGVLVEFAALAQEGRELQDWDLAAGALEARGTALLALRRWPEALADLRMSVRLAWDGLEVMALAYALWNVTPVLARLRQGRLAAEVMGAAEALWRQRFGAFDASDLRDLKRVRRFVRVLLGPQAAAAAWQQGAAQPLAAVVRAVLAA